MQAALAGTGEMTDSLKLMISAQDAQAKLKQQVGREINSINLIFYDLAFTNRTFVT